MTGVVVLNKVRLADPLSESPAAILFPVATASNGAAVYAIASGGAHQLLANANPVRRGWWLQNHSSGDLWVGKGASAAAAPPCIRIKPGELYEVPAHMATGDALRVFGATTGQSFSFEEC